MKGIFLEGRQWEPLLKFLLIGPAVAAIAEQIGSGDVAGGLGSTVGTAGGALLPGGAAKLAGVTWHVSSGGSSEFLKHGLN